MVFRLCLLQAQHRSVDVFYFQRTDRLTDGKNFEN